MFYEYIDEKTIKKAPKPLKIGGKDIYTNSEKIHNENGYFKIKHTDYPQDDKCYEPRYTRVGNFIYQTWLVSND